MANASLVAFNRGILSALGLARVDIQRLRMAAEIQTNWMPRVLGSMMLRPGLKHLDATEDDEVAINIPFVFSADSTALLELTDNILRVFVDDELVERPTVTAAVSNGSFTTDLTGWTDADESGGTSSWVEENVGGVLIPTLQLLGDGAASAIRRQVVTVNQTGVEHALEIDVLYGPVLIRVGSSAGTENYITETALDAGKHSLSFTPTGNFHIQLSSKLDYPVNVNSVAVASSGAMRIETTIDEADLPYVRYAQSGDIVFIAFKENQQLKIERRGPRSWSVVDYESISGPWRIINTSQITMAPAALSGQTTVTASASFFKSTHVGGMLRIASVGQLVTSAISAADTFTNPIRVSGVGDQRQFTVSIIGTFSATVTLQYSVAEPGAWVDVATYTGATGVVFDDDLDNQVIYYRIGIDTGDYASGTATCSLLYGSGSITGVGRIIKYTSATQVTVRVLKHFGGTAASKDWWESAWSGLRGWPSAVAFHEGRLWWAGQDKIWGSISDSYYEFDDEFEGDAGPISRSIGFGPIQNIHWLLGLQRLLMGTAQNSSNTAATVVSGNGVIAVRSSSLDEPLTPTNFNLKQVSPVGLFVDRSGTRLFELGFDGDDYIPSDLNLLNPDLNEVGISYIAVQMKPDVRIHCVLTDGTVSLLVLDRAENVAAWVKVETDGDIEHCAVLPGSVEDQIYYVVKRTIDGNTKRFVEKWALESNCTGRPEGHIADSHVLYNGAATTTISGLDHLEGETVVAWGWNTATPFTDADGNAIGRDFGTFTVDGGEIELSAAVTDACVGLSYTADFKSVKLQELNWRKKILEFALSLMNTHYQGVKIGRDFNNLYSLPTREKIKPTAEHHVWDELDMDMTTFGGEWDTDARVCMRAQAPRPCTIRAAIIDYQR